MSAFFATCPNCGEKYFFCFVGSALVSGHFCPVTKERVLPELVLSPKAAERAKEILKKDANRRKATEGS